jgi:hypothetical protein
MARRELCLPLGAILLLIALGTSTGCSDNKPAPKAPALADPDAEFKPKAAGRGG